MSNSRKENLRILKLAAAGKLKVSDLVRSDEKRYKITMNLGRDGVDPWRRPDGSPITIDQARQEAKRRGVRYFITLNLGRS